MPSIDDDRERRIDALATRFRSGDTEAVRELYREMGGAAYAVAFRVLGNRVHAEDAVQQAFLSAWKSRETLDPARGLRFWMFSIVKRAALDVARRERLRAHGPVDDTIGHPALVESPELERADEVWKVREAVDLLPSEERTVVRLQHFEGLSHAQIADRLDVAVGTVKSRSHRAHQRLAGYLRSLREVTP